MVCSRLNFSCFRLVCFCFHLSLLVLACRTCLVTPGVRLTSRLAASFQGCSSPKEILKVYSSALESTEEEKTLFLLHLRKLLHTCNTPKGEALSLLADPDLVSLSLHESSQVCLWQLAQARPRDFLVLAADAYPQSFI